LAEAWAEQTSSMDNLIAKYKQLARAGEDYQDVVKDIVDAVPDLIKSYKDLTAGLNLGEDE
jgi:hypothetical protein